MTTLEKVVRHPHVSMFGVRHRGNEFRAECFLRRDVVVTSKAGDTPEAAIEALWAEILRQFPLIMPPGF